MARERRNEDISAVRAAFNLLAVPSRRRQMRKARLPNDVVLLLRIVADDLTSEAFASHVRKSPNRLREAAAFYIEQIMLAPDADSYRVLGSRGDASTAELRRNLAYLCKWLHSDVCRETARSVFLLRVTQAWNNVKTPERRRAYDLGLDVGMEARRIAPENRLHRDSNDPKRNGKTSLASRNASRFDGSLISVARRRSNLWRRFIAFALGRPR